MALFEEEKSNSNGIFAQNDLNTLTPKIGDSIGFYLHSEDERRGEDGKFKIVNGLKLDLSAASIDEMIASAEPINFIPRLVLEKKMEEGNFNFGEAYRLEKTLNRGDKHPKTQKTVRYYAWDVYRVNAPAEVLGKLKGKVLELQGGSVLGTETKAPEMPKV